MYKSIRPTIIIYFSWITFSFLAYLLSTQIPHHNLLFEWFFSPGFKLFSVLGLLLITTHFLIYQEQYLQRQSRIRLKLLTLFVSIEVIVFLAVRFTGQLTTLTAILGSANLIIIALLIGTWLVYPLKRVTDLIPLCLVMSSADIYSVFVGPSKIFSHNIAEYYIGGMKGIPPFSDFLLIKFPTVGVNLPYPIFGVSDWLIIVFFSAAALKFNISDNLIGKSVASICMEKRYSPYLPISVVGLAIAILLSNFTGIFLPALPVISSFFIFYLIIRFPEARLLNRSDWIIILTLILLFLIVGIIHKRLSV